MDFSDDMLLELYDNESKGIGRISPQNGFAMGKKWMDVTIAMWREDMWITLDPDELYECGTFPHWWLDRVIGDTREPSWGLRKILGP